MASMMVVTEWRMTMQRRTRRNSANSRWNRDEEKEKYWRAQIALWQQSGLSVRAFCKENGVVETSFYAWRRELIVRAREDHSPEEARTLESTPNKLKDGRGRDVSIRFRQTDHHALQSLVEAANDPSPFVPLKVVPEVSAQRQRCEAPSATITMTTPAGYQITVSHSDDLDLLSKLLHVLEKSNAKSATIDQNLFVQPTSRHAQVI
jgi:transposase-like protein